ncbi:hypothetical protein GE09DRAFT_313618 [Coniochaeta sp. 2T2.1]|nr:hypothetical protein GE09DRAFT_313618 [Coniochaeta sp. 2T2.1]
MVRQQVERGNNLFQYINSLATLQYETDVVMGRARGTTPHFPRTRRFTMTKRPAILGAPRPQSEPEQPQSEPQPEPQQEEDGNRKPGFVKNSLQWELWRLEREGQIPPEYPKPWCDPAAWDKMLWEEYPHLAPAPQNHVFPPPGLETQEPRTVRDWFREGPATDAANKAFADDPVGLMTPAQLQRGGGARTNDDEGGGEKNLYYERPAGLDGGGDFLAPYGIDNGAQPVPEERKRPLQQPARRSSAIFAALAGDNVEPSTTA